jgi:tRNA pseudouridine55 synthase
LRDLDGILLLDKPLRISSAAAVARAKRIFAARKAGHTGSLDPLASGFLAIGFGEATKFGAHLLESDKTYRVGVRLGERTPSDDRETEVCERRELPPWSRGDIESVLAAFPRVYAQMPPMHSALKQDGKPLYEYARAGIERVREPRAVVIHRLELLDWSSPDLSLEVTCSKGTYIRVLAVELASMLGTIGHLAELRRLSVAPFEGSVMHGFDELESMSEAARDGCLLPLDAALLHWPPLQLEPSLVSQLRQGQPVPVAGEHSGPVRIYGPDRRFIGLGEVSGLAARADAATAGGPGAATLVARRLIAAASNPA